MNTNQLKKFAQAARIRLLEDVKNRFLYWGIDKNGNIVNRVDSTSGGYVFRGNVFNDETVPKKWDNLFNAVKLHTPNDIIEEAAYTWFNRLIAIKILEENGYDNPIISYVSSELYDPIILQEAKRGNIPNMDEKSKRQLNEYINNANDDEALSLLIIHYCKNHKLLNRLFGRIDDYTELLLPNNILSKDGIISLINNTDYITEEDFQQVELIGWLYQFYISDKKDDVFASFKKKQKARAEDIPAATQIFTPKWIVKYLIENTVGRIWLDKHPDSPIRNTMKYLVEPEDVKPNKPIIDKVEHLKVLDPAVGSGHFLVVAFDLLMQTYKEEGYINRYAVESIIENNLYGLDLCKRAVGLANFAILLKGASYFPEILQKDITPHIIAMPEQYAFSKQQVFDFLGDEGRQYVDELETALEQMQSAQNIGSALVIELSNDAREFIQKRFNNYIKQEKQSELNLFESSSFNIIKPFIQSILILTDKYPSVVTNPPYMGSKNMNVELGDYLKTHYPISKADLFAVFMEVCTNRNPKSGLMGMINQHSWMFLGSFENIRKKIIQNYTIINMLHLGPRLFDELSGEVVQSTAFLLKKTENKDFLADFFRLVEYRSSHSKETQFLKRNHHFNNLSQKDFLKIPGSPIAYWINEKIANMYEGQKLGDVALFKTGITTGDNTKFFRFWYESNFSKIQFNLIRGKDIVKKWVPIKSGGGFRRWYGNNHFIVNWENNGNQIKKFKNKNNQIASTIRSENLQFLPSLTWSKLSNPISVRIVPEGFMFDAVGLSSFSKKNKNLIICGILNSKIASYFTNITNSSMSILVSDLIKIPYNISNNHKINIEKLVKQNKRISKKDWDSHEVSWNYNFESYLNSISISESYYTWEGKVTLDFFKLHENEEELNRIFIDIYGLQEELTPDVALKDITILQEELDKTELANRNDELLISKTGLPIKKDVVIKQLLSYAVGCFMGRYRLDKPGLNVAHPNPTSEELSSYKYNDHTFEIDDDGIIPLMGGESPFADDIVFRTKEFVRMVWGDESFTENLNFINECLGEDLEKYLTKKFWNDHKKTYKKKPIYWQFASNGGAFKVICYMHRMDRFTVQKIRQNYLFKQINWYEREISQLAENEATLTSKESRLLDTYRKGLVECREYDLLLKDTADKQIEFDLDDGVTENYKLFDGVVSKI